MEKRIINLSEAKEEYGCIICCKNQSTTKVEILTFAPTFFNGNFHRYILSYN